MSFPQGRAAPSYIGRRRAPIGAGMPCFYSYYISLMRQRSRQVISTNKRGHIMSAKNEPSSIKQAAANKTDRLVLNDAAIDAARQDLDQGAVTPSFGPWREDIIKLLNDSLATELVCVLRYKRHHFTADGLASAKIAEEFLVHANEESDHADRLAQRIVQLGGTPDFSPDSLTQRSHAAYDDSTDLKAMIRANLIAERVAIESYSQIIALIGDKDSTTRRLIEDILSVEQQHAEELKDWLAD
jgi:bacterioferritin